MTNENKVYVQRIFECDQVTLFEWLTKPNLIAQWFGPEDFTVGKISCNLVEGGSYSIELNKGSSLSFTVFGRYLEIVSPTFLKFSYDYIGLEGRPSSVISFRLDDAGPGRTDLSMVQEFESKTPDFETRTKAWNFMFARLWNLLSND